MGGGLGLAAAGALVISLISPGEKSGADTAISRGMLGDPTTTAGLKGGHAGGASDPVNGVESCLGEAVVSHPPILGCRVSDDGI